MQPAMSAMTRESSEGTGRVRGAWIFVGIMSRDSQKKALWCLALVPSFAHCWWATMPVPKAVTSRQRQLPHQISGSSGDSYPEQGSTPTLPSSYSHHWRTTISPEQPSIARISSQGTHSHIILLILYDGSVSWHGPSVIFIHYMSWQPLLVWCPRRTGDREMRD